MRQNESYKIYIRPPVGPNTVLCKSKENAGIILKNEYDMFKSNSLHIVQDIEQYNCDPLDYFTDHVKITKS